MPPAGVEGVSGMLPQLTLEQIGLLITAAIATVGTVIQGGRMWLNRPSRMNRLRADARNRISG